MTWRLAKSLETLRAQVDALAPNRDKSSDGTIGDPSHAARASDHNPDAHGVVRAMDISHDPAHGVDTYKLAEILRQNQDSRIKYVISNHRIFNSTVSAWKWRPYSGSNPHDHHVHVSVVGNDAVADDTRPWAITLSAPVAGGEVSRRRLSEGDEGDDVKEVQQLLGIPVDGVFGAATDAAVRAFQGSKGIDIDGIVGPYTWDALSPSTAKPAPVTSAGLSPEAIARIVSIAGSSSLASVNWSGRGVAPRGYIKGMAVTFAKVYLDLKAGKSSALAMTAPLGSPDKDALVWYGVARTDSAGVLRALFALLIGLGMRESSGKYYEGRDASASNTSSDTAEAGLFQQSFNSFAASKELPKIFDAYTSGGLDGFVSIFREGLSGSPGQGSGDGAQGLAFQSLCKSKPAFAVECAAVGLRVLRAHWGPINRREVELRPEADALLQQVQQVVDAVVTKPITEPIIIPPKKPGEPVPTPPKIELSLFERLFLNLLERRMTTPGQGLDLRRLYADFRAFIRNPIVQRLLNGGAATLDELATLPGELIMMLTGDGGGQPALPPPVTVMPVTEPQPAPPVTPVVDPAKPVAPAPAPSTPPKAPTVSPLWANLGTAGTLLSGIAALWAGGAMPDTTAIVSSAVATALSFTGIPAPVINAVLSQFKGLKLTRKTT